MGVVEGGEEVTQRLGEADGNYVCLALCTGRENVGWIPFGEIFVFTIFYSLYILVSFLLEFCQKSFLLCVFLSGVYFD